MTKTQVDRLRAAKDGLLRLAERETHWDGDKEFAPSSFKRFPPVDALLPKLDHASDRRAQAA